VEKWIYNHRKEQRATHDADEKSFEERLSRSEEMSKHVEALHGNVSCCARDGTGDRRDDAHIATLERIALGIAGAQKAGPAAKKQKAEPPKKPPTKRGGWGRTCL
jgi:hypothetical protein